MQIAAHIRIWLIFIYGAAHIAADPVDTCVRSPRPCQTVCAVHTSLFRCNYTVIKDQSVGRVCLCSRSTYISALRVSLFIDKYKFAVLEQRSGVITGINKVNQTLNPAIPVILVTGMHVKSILHA